MKRNHAIDAVRAIACTGVLFVHAAFPNPFGLYVAALARFAVPFFLMVSGYYAYRPASSAALQNAKRQLHASARLTLIGTLLYAFSNTIRQLLYGQAPLSWLSSLLHAEGIFNFLVLNRAVFLSSVMYYLFMLLYVYGLFLLLLKTNTMPHAQRLIPLLLGACVLLDEFLGMPWYYSGNFLLTGLPFFLLGYRFAKTPPRIAHPEWFILPGLLLTLLETAWVGEAYCYLGTLLTSIFLFLTCLRHPQPALPEWLVRFGRRGSVVVFLVHCAVRDYLYMLIPDHPATLAYLRPLAVLAVSIALAHRVVRKKAAS